MAALLFKRVSLQYCIMRTTSFLCGRNPALASIPKIKNQNSFTQQAGQREGRT
jgi:hypothetical protein